MSEHSRTSPPTIPAAAARAAEAWPDEPAVLDGARVWTFSELWRDARAAAGRLIERGLEPGERVAIWAPNSPEWVIAALGAQTAGAAIVPLNTRFKGREAAALIRRARCKVLFTVGSFLGADYSAMLEGEDLPDLRETVFLDQDNPILAGPPGASPGSVEARLATVGPDTVSDIIFTSGTTGEPKGAVTAHGQVTRLFGEWAERVDLRQGDRYLIVNPFFHTFGYKAGWVACLIRGAAFIPLPIFDIRETIRQIEENGVSFLPGPPTIYQSLLAELAGERRPDFSSLRVAVTGAAPVPPALVKRMREELGMQNVVNGYGMTECGAISMTRQGDDAETIANTCGYPLPSVEVRCVDDDGRDLGPGETGEFWVRSPCVMRGYLDDPAATAETIDAQGWLRTGDVGSIDAKGYLRITDRKKDMYISGGFNCYPAEIEKLLSAHPAIEMAAVVSVPDERLGEVGKAFVVLRKGAEADAAAIIAWARETMANYKVPRSVAFVDELPRNAGGKVLRRVLREMTDEH